MKKDIVAKGAIVQRDRRTYAITPHIPGGIVSAVTLRKIAAVAEKYCATIKVTSAQRLTIIGLEEEQLDAAWAELDGAMGYAIGKCVRSVKICPGIDFCKRAQQDSMGVGLRLDEDYHGRSMPWKCKLAVSGCPNDCAEVCIKDIGLIGTTKGWNVMVGGNGGAAARLAIPLATALSTGEALAMVDKVICWFEHSGYSGRLGKLINKIGVEQFVAEVNGQG